MKYPLPSGAVADVEAGPGDYLKDLKFTFMGSFLARKNDGAILADLIYLDLSGQKGKATVPLDLTWQALVGVGYRWDWGDLVLAYHHPSYDMGSDKLLQDTDFSGPALGVVFRFQVVRRRRMDWTTHFQLREVSRGNP